MFTGHHHLSFSCSHELEKNVVKTKSQLNVEIKQIWADIPKSFIRNLYENILRRLEPVIRNKGGHTNY